LDKYTLKDCIPAGEEALKQPMRTNQARECLQSCTLKSSELHK